MILNDNSYSNDFLHLKMKNLFKFSMFSNLKKFLFLSHFKNSKANEFVKITFSIAELSIFFQNL